MQQLPFQHQPFHKPFHPILQLTYHSLLHLKHKTSKHILKPIHTLTNPNTNKLQKNPLKLPFLSQHQLPIFTSF
ncbi:peptidoglycan bridge formation glycyltransferase FemA/FemB family protein, partial [Staphylococcus capitis]|uniref:peptidoglycan bridge formation glycyltransferase FemA/FemB family protein n=1 Tax=Staphylococcus capitis TaxID=29388 RepID=UPI0037097852